MDTIGPGTILLGAAVIWLVVAATRRRAQLEFRARLFEIIGTAARRGLPLSPGLRRMSESMPDRRGAVLRELAAQLDAGEPLGHALEAALPRGTIPEETLATIHAAEGTAALQETLESLGTDATHVQHAQDRIASALAYPSVLAVALIGTYASTEPLVKSLPASGVEVGSAVGVASYVVAFVLLTVLAVALAAEVAPLRGAVHSALVAVGRRVPVVRVALRFDAASRVLRVASALCSTGLPLGDVLRRAAHGTRHPEVRTGVLHAARAADEGVPPGEVWERSGLPDFAVAFASLAVGAEPAEVGNRLRQAANACERRVARHTARAVAALQPAAIMAFGVLVALHFANVVETVQASRILAPGGNPW